MKKSDFYYDLPVELIAQHPTEKRDDCRLLILDGRSGQYRDGVFTELKDLLKPGDCLVLNDTRVIPARLIGRKEGTDVPVEFLLLERKNRTDWEIICRPGRRLKPGARIIFLDDKLTAEIIAVLPGGNRLVRFFFSGIWEEVLDRVGQVPLPPYIHEQLEDKERYQTVYAEQPGSSAAPTAGLHFTKEMLADLVAAGIKLAYVTLNIGLGTFRPVKEEEVQNHHMHSEYFTLTAEACRVINETKQRGDRVICIGTTSCRVVESAADEEGLLHPQSAYTDIFIYPGYRFKCMDALVTNFHLPESTLIMLVSAFAGYRHTMAAYRHAVIEQYRFFSFGDAMFITGPALHPEEEITP